MVTRARQAYCGCDRLETLEREYASTMELAGEQARHIREIRERLGQDEAWEQPNGTSLEQAEAQAEAHAGQDQPAEREMPAPMSEEEAKIVDEIQGCTTHIEMCVVIAIRQDNKLLISQAAQMIRMAGRSTSEQNQLSVSLRHILRYDPRWKLNGKNHAEFLPQGDGPDTGPKEKNHPETRPLKLPGMMDDDPKPQG